MLSKALPLLLVAILGGRGWCASAAAPDFTLKEPSGKLLRLNDLRGQAVLLDFWATWCDSCMESLAFYERLSKRRRSDTFVVLGIDEGEKAKTVLAFEKKNSMTYRVLLDPNREVYDAYGIRGLPTAMLIDDTGIIRGRWTGFNEEIASDIETMVKSLESARQLPQ